MTINGPAPMLLAFFLNAAIDQQCEKYIREQGLGTRSRPRSTRSTRRRGSSARGTQGTLPEGQRRARA